MKTDSGSRDPDDRPTSVPCPACEAAGFVVASSPRDADGPAPGAVCAFCQGAKLVTVEQLRLWNLAHRVGAAT
jgi:hypothetical protein